MHARVIDTEKRPHYGCSECEDLDEGTVATLEVWDIRHIYNDLPVPEWLTPEELEEKYDTRTIFVCPQGHRGDEDEIVQKREIWMCGHCEAKYDNSSDAADCCL